MTQAHNQPYDKPLVRDTPQPVLSAESARPPVESIQYLLDVFIEGGWAQDEDAPHIDNIYFWLEGLKQAAHIDGNGGGDAQV